MAKVRYSIVGTGYGRSCVGFRFSVRERLRKLSDKRLAETMNQKRPFWHMFLNGGRWMRKFEKLGIGARATVQRLATDEMNRRRHEMRSAA